MRAELISFPDPADLPALEPKPITDTMARDVAMLRVLERQADAAYLAFRSVVSEYPGAEWSRVTDPLRDKWIALERAITLLRATWL